MSNKYKLFALYVLPYVLVYLLGTYTARLARYLTTFDGIMPIVAASFIFIVSLSIIHPLFKFIGTFIDDIKGNKNKSEIK